MTRDVGRLHAAGDAGADRPARRRRPVHLAARRFGRRPADARRQRLYPVGPAARTGSAQGAGRQRLVPQRQAAEATTRRWTRSCSTSPSAPPATARPPSPQTLLDHIGDRRDLLPRSHRDAGYFVLLAPDVPAVLLEMGFITNPDDEARLNDPAQRGRLMDAVAEAIDDLFRRPTGASRGALSARRRTWLLGTAPLPARADDALERSAGACVPRRSLALKPPRTLDRGRRRRRAERRRGGGLRAGRSTRPGCSTTCPTPRSWSTITRRRRRGSTPGTAP